MVSCFRYESSLSVTIPICDKAHSHFFIRCHIQLSHRVYHDMYMDVSGRVMTVGMSADYRLMSGEVFLCKIYGKCLGRFQGETIFIPVPRIEADDIVMSFHFAFILVFMKSCIGRLTLFCKGVGIAVDPVKKIFFSWQLPAILVQYRF